VKTARQRPPVWAVFLGAGLATAAAFLLVAGPVLRTWLLAASYMASAGVLAKAWWASRTTRPEPAPLFGLLALGITLMATACVSAILVPMATGQPVPVPSFIDGLFLLAYLLFAAFFVQIGRRSGSADRWAWIDPVIVLLGMAPLFWLVLVDPLLMGAAFSLELATFLAYPALVFALLTMMVRTTLAASYLSVPHGLVAGWIFLELAADIFQMQEIAAGTFNFGRWYGALWVLSGSCIGALALHPRTPQMLFARRANRPVTGPRRLLVLGACMALPIITLAYTTHTERQQTVLLPAAVALVLVVLTYLRLANLMRDLSFQSLHDTLTGLGNRSLFADRLENALRQRPLEADRAAAVLLLDLDDFKTINDSFGHDAGDRVLVEVARRLECVTRQGEGLFRLGGDEFAFVLTNARVNDALRLADRICATLDEPLEVGPRQIRPQASLGIAVALAGQDRTKLLAEADLAMYDSKERMTNQPTVFDAQLHEKALDRHQLERDLRSAVEARQLRLLYQPLVHLETNEMVGVEALVRWEHPTRGMVSPVDFIPIAEINNAILDIGDWVLREACRQALEWDLARSDRQLRVSVNVSPRQLADPDYVTRTRSILADTGIAPSRVTLEVTESAFAMDTDIMIARLHDIKRLGVSLAIDDFGTGYSSLSQLRKLPVDYLKIDKSFVDGIAREQAEWELTTAIIRLAAGLGKSTVAEGIETGGQLAHLRSLNVELGQGYLFARPLTAMAIAELLQLGHGRAFLYA